MPKRKSRHPFRTGYKVELSYPRRAAYPPTHGPGPRCRVDFDLSDDGPWSMLQIMQVENDEVEEYTCAMPRCYAVPLILMNKRLAFFEASCHPDGTPILTPRPPTTTTDNDDDGTDYDGGRGGGLRERDLREYSYLWQLRTRFLQAVYDMNHERRLDERWRYLKIHGFVYRLYRRYGHEDNQRILYWRDEIKAGRVPYGTPDIADMDWESYIIKEIASGAHINGFLWNRVSQGYARVMKDEQPQEAWRAWRRGAASRGTKPVLYRTPACSPVRDDDPLPSVGSAHNGAGPEHQHQQRQQQGQAQSQSQLQTRSPCNPEAEGAAATATRAAGDNTSGSAAAGRCAGINGDGDEGDGDVTMEYEVLTAALSPENPHTQEWTLPFPVSGQSSEAAGSGSPGRLVPKQVLLKFNAPENVKLAVVHCTFSPVKDVEKDFRTQLKLAYTSKVS